MIITAIAFALVTLIVIFRTVGLPSTPERDARGLGARYKRLRVAFHSTMWGGPAILILGESIGLKWIYHLGIIIWIMAGPLFLGVIVEIIRSKRRIREGQSG
ncbi:MAG: hypothetical protein HIU84_13100 [Acidobacteria bacterium]|nr:hypothetical protein [Acidobacteriota bacterium]